MFHRNMQIICGCLWLIIAHHGFPSKTDSRDVKGGLLRIISSHLIILSYVLESETLHWPDPQFREVPCFRLHVPLKIPLGGACPGGFARTGEDTKEESGHQKEPEGSNWRVGCLRPMTAEEGWNPGSRVVLWLETRLHPTLSHCTALTMGSLALL